MRVSRIFITLATITLFFLLNSSLFLNNVNAADARNYNAGRIIDDSVFTNSNSMSVQDIQNFLNSKMPNCDTYGTGPSGAGGTNRQWLEARGYSPPYKCVRDYRENPSTGENNYGKSADPVGSLSSAELIYNYSRQFNINPQVLIVTLQKENGMITDNIPIPKQYSEAMGFGCPDNTAPGAPACDSAYGSFSAQLYQAARHFRGYLNNSPGWWIPYVVGWNSIELKPKTTCGTSDVYIENRSTVALYSYTPYVPNQAAKNAQYGLGDACSSYGNRNFYLYFTDWFGSTNSDVAITSPLRVTSGYSTGLYTKVPTTVSFNITNNRSYPIGIGSMAVTVRDSQGRNLDYGLQPVYIPAYGTVTYSSSQLLPREETYTFSIVNFSGGEWKANYPESSSISNPRQHTFVAYEMPTRTSNINFDSDLRAGKDTIVSFSVKNNSSSGSVNAGTLAVAVRGPNGENLDLSPENMTLSPNQQRTYSRTFRPPYPGVYRFFIASTLNNGATWESNFPLPNDNTVVSTIESTAKVGLTVTQSVQSSLGSSAHVGQAPTLSFKLRNLTSSSLDLGKVGLAGRDPLGRNVDPGVVPVVLAAGEERLLTFNTNLSIQGKYQYAIISTGDNGKTWWDGPSPEDSTIAKTLSFNAGSGVTVTQGPELSQASPHVGQNMIISMKVKNYGLSSLDLGKVGLAGRDPLGRNVDPGVVPVILAAGEEKTLSFPVGFTTSGVYKYSVIQTVNNGAVWTSGPDQDSAAVAKEANVSIKPAVTVTDGLNTSSSLLSVGQSTTLSFTVKNFSGSSINLGKIGLMGRSSSGRNVDPGVVPVVLAAGEERTLNFVFTPGEKNIYRFTLLGTSDNGMTWNGGPTLDSTNQRSLVDVTVQ